MLERTQLFTLAKQVARANPNAPVAYSFGGKDYSYATLQETLRRELNEYAGTYAAYRENKNLIFALIEEVIDDVLPKKVEQAYDQFAETKVFKQGDKPKFTRKLYSNRQRGKQFVTRVGLAGVYEVFKLGKATESFEVPTSAIGGAAQIGLEEFLDGRVDFSELIDVVMEGMDDLIFEEIGKALVAATGQLPAANQAAAAGFDEDAFDTLVRVAAAYGEPTIYCTDEFAVKLLPAEAWRYTESMKEEFNRKGYLSSYKGKRVIILPQGFKDETNSEKVIDPGHIWIIPNGADTKPVKIAFEGQTLVDERKNADWSRDVHVYKKVGVVAMMANNICHYVDTSLLGQMTTWNYDANVINKVVAEVQNG